MRAWLLAALALAPGCECSKAPEPASSHLRVPKPDGWTYGSEPSSVLQVGPPGRPVVQLERESRPLPGLDALVAAVTAEGVEVIEKESNEGFVGVRYSIAARGARQEAFLGVRQAGALTVWCATLAGARGDEVEQAMAICRSVAWEG